MSVSCTRLWCSLTSRCRRVSVIRRASESGPPRSSLGCSSRVASNRAVKIRAPFDASPSADLTRATSRRFASARWMVRDRPSRLQPAIMNPSASLNDDRCTPAQGTIGAVPQAAVIPVMTRRYSSRLASLAAYSPENSERDRKCCSVRLQEIVSKGLIQSRTGGYRVPCDPRAVTVCHEVAAPGQATSGVRRLLSRPNRSRRGERYSVIRLQSPSSSPGSLAAAQVRAPCARHQPTLIAAARYQTAASSPRGTFSQAELTAKTGNRRIQGRRVRPRCCPASKPRAPAKRGTWTPGAVVLGEVLKSW
jgi:hypothetical protein